MDSRKLIQQIKEEQYAKRKKNCIFKNCFRMGKKYKCKLDCGEISRKDFFLDRRPVLFYFYK